MRTESTPRGLTPGELVRKNAAGNGGRRERLTLSFQHKGEGSHVSVCQDSSLQCAITGMGEDRVLFSVDYPFEDAKQAAD